MTDGPAAAEVAAHYEPTSLIDRITAGLERSGIALDSVTVDDLAAVDEFHTGGRPATEAVIAALGVDADQRVLDIGCGLGGAARFCATTTGARVTGIDLTPGYIEAARALTGWTGLADRIDLHCGSAIDLPFAEAEFDAAYLLHVGMNIADKHALFAEVARVLVPGGRLVVYDVMVVGPGEVEFPVPWATTPATSAVARPEDYEGALTGAGFEVTGREDRTELALAVLAQARERARSAPEPGPPPLGLHLLMGPTVTDKTRNLAAALTGGVVAPIVLHCRRG